ncbi:MAG: hypothetical protein M9894_16595 [Planctomycetes bacterium]|nr:hypothetical protein [Planctomycetota bacterium]
MTDEGHLAGANDLEVREPTAAPPLPPPAPGRTRGLVGALDDAGRR